MTESMQGPNKGTKPCSECGAPTIAVSEILPALAHMRDSCVPLARVWVGEQKPAPPESVQGPERLAALIDDTVRWIRLQRGASGGWLHPKLNRPDAVANEVELRLSHVKAGLVRGVSLPDSGDAPRAESPEEIIEIDERGVVHPKGRKSTVLLDPEPEGPCVASAPDGLHALLQRFIDWHGDSMTSAAYLAKYGHDDSLDDLIVQARAALGSAPHQGPTQ